MTRFLRVSEAWLDIETPDICRLRIVLEPSAPREFFSPLGSADTATRFTFLASIKKRQVFESNETRPVSDLSPAERDRMWLLAGPTAGELQVGA